MASDAEGLRITREELSQFAAKMEAWARSLPEHEREILSRIISRAGDAGEIEDGVSAYDLYMQNPRGSNVAQIAQAVGLNVLGGSTSNVFNLPRSTSG
jgi:hypothetical protein